MEVRSTKLTGLVTLRPRVFNDKRGHFTETYSERIFRDLVADVCFVQDNQSLSLRAGTVRALHLQSPPKAQAKLVRVVQGSIFDVAVDLRKRSPTFGLWFGLTLSASNGEQMFVPHGFAHGFCTLEPETKVSYKVDEYYSPECEQGIAWDDPTIGVNWPVNKEDAILSEKDRANESFANFTSPFEYD